MIRRKKKDITSGIIFSAVIVAAAAVFLFFTMRNVYVTVASGVLGVGIILLVFFLDKNRFDGFIVRFVEWFSLMKRFEDFTLGVLKLSPIVYYLSFSAAFIFLAIRIIEKRRWA